MIRRRAQLFPLFFALVPVLLIGLVAIWNILGFQGGGGAAIQSAAQSAAQSVLRLQTVSSFGRYYIDPTAGEADARNMVYAALAGQSGTGDYLSSFAEDLLGVVYDDAVADPSGVYSYELIGTDDRSQPGVDIEIINNGDIRGTYWTTRTLNGTTVDVREGTLIACTGSDGTPGATSEILNTSECITETTVIVRIRLRVPQFGGGTTFIEAIAAAAAGTSGVN